MLQKYNLEFRLEHWSRSWLVQFVSKEGEIVDAAYDRSGSSLLCPDFCWRIKKRIFAVLSRLGSHLLLESNSQEKYRDDEGEISERRPLDVGDGNIDNRSTFRFAGEDKVIVWIKREIERFR